MSKYELRYRVIPNSTCSDFNSELPYTLVSVDFDRKTNLIRQRGFNTWSNHNNDLFSDRKMAEKWLCELNYNTFFNKDKDRQIANLQSQLDQANERLKGAIIPRYAIGTKLYMIPTEFNRLKGIKDYELLSISLSSIGLRYDLSLNKKEKGVEPFYCASEDMFGQSIFSTLEEAEKKLQELRNGVFSGE